MDMPDIRDAVLLATLPHAAVDGWVDCSLRAGARDAGFPEATAFRAFPGGPRDAVRHWVVYKNRRMVEEMQRRDLAAMRVRDRIAAGIRIRLEMVTPHREAVRRAVAFLALPQNVPLSVELTHDTVNELWYAAGDASTDFNFYTKRALLAAVYASTVLCWLGDESEGFADTWAFLDRRIDDAMQLPKLTSRIGVAVGAVLSPLSWLGRKRAF